MATLTKHFKFLVVFRLQLYCTSDIYLQFQVFERLCFLNPVATWQQTYKLLFCRKLANEWEVSRKTVLS